MKISVNIILSLIYTILLPTFIFDGGLGFSNSCFSLLVMVAFYLFFDHAGKQDFSRRLKLFGYGAGVIFSALTAVGYSFQSLGMVNIFSLKLYAVILLFSHPIAMLLCCLWSLLEKNETKLAESKNGCRICYALQWLLNHRLAVAAVIFICWMPCWLSTYPGNFRYDAAAELAQGTDGYNGDFPLLHSLLIIRILHSVKSVTGSYNTGIAVFVVLQMAALCLLFAQIIYTLKQHRINIFILTALLGYYALFPAIHMLVTCTVRDVMFSGLLTASVFLFYLMALDYKKFMSRWTNPLTLGLVLVLTILSRNNNIGFIVPVILVFACAAVAFCCRKAGFKGIAVFSATVLGGYFVFTALLTALCQPVVPAKDASSMSLCAQSLARAYYEGGENWSQQDLESFFRYFPDGEPKYIAENADPAKFALTIPEGETMEFLKFWVKTGMRQPTSYINALLANTRQMWFPAVVIDGYNQWGGFFEDYEKCYLTFSARTEAPDEIESKLPQLLKFYEKLGLFISFEKVPVVSMLFSVGFHVWLLINCCFYVAYRRCRHLVLPLAVLSGYTLISAFVPLVLLRYFSALFFAFPMVIAWSVQPASPLYSENNQ